MSEIQITFKEAEVSKISLGPNEVLAVKLVGVDAGEEALHHFTNSLKKLFPKNKVFVFTVPEGNDVEFTTIAEEAKEKVDCSLRVCDDCSCGKAEKLGAMEQLTELTEELGLYKGEFE